MWYYQLNHIIIIIINVLLNKFPYFITNSSVVTIIIMSRASQIEQDNDNQFHLLANKVSTFKNIANDINLYAQEDNNNLNSISNQLNTLGENIKSTASKLNHVMRSNPKITKMVGIGFVIFLIIYYSLKYLF